MTRPRVTLKLATSLDGRIATASGESRWLTGPQARERVHEMRAAHDAVLVGSATAIADDPELTVRLPDYAGAQPLRVVLTGETALPPGLKLLSDGGATLVIPGGPAPAEALAALAERGLSAVLIEGGGRIAAAFLRAGMVDEIAWFRAPLVLGAEGRPALGELAIDRLADAPRFTRLEVEVFGPDLLERYQRI